MYGRDNRHNVDLYGDDIFDGSCHNYERRRLDDITIIYGPS